METGRDFIFGGSKIAAVGNCSHEFKRHFLLGRKAMTNPERESESCSVLCNFLRPHGLYNPWNSLGQNTGVNSRSLLQETFPTQGSNPGLLYCRQILYQLSQQGSPDSKESACSVGGPGLISGSGRSPGGGNGNWTIRRTEEPGRLQSMVSQRVGHN